MLSQLLTYRGAASLRTFRPSRTQIVQPEIESFVEWRWNGVRAALASHEEGDFRDSGNLIQSMGRDDRISACLRNRKNAILSRNGDFRIETADGGSDEIAKRVEGWWWRVVPDDMLGALSCDMVMAGVALARVHWVRTEREWAPVRLERWYTQNIRWDVTRRQYMALTETGEVAIDPGDPNWILITPGGDRSWLSGSVRALGLPFLMRQFNWRDWARFNERHGMPIIAIREPAGQYSEGIKKGFYAGVKRMGSTGILRLPKAGDNDGFDITMIEAKDRAFETFKTFRGDLDVSIAVYMLGQNLLVEAEGGSYALGTVQNLIRLDVRAADIEVLATSLRAQLINSWGLYNFASWDSDVAPWPTWDTSDPVDREKESLTLKQTAEAITELKSSKLPIDWKEVCDRMALPLVEGAPLPDPPDPNEPAPAPPPVLPPDVAGQDPNARYTKESPRGGAGLGIHPHGGNGSSVRLASGDVVPADDGFVEGQEYADRLAGETAAKASAALDPLRKRLAQLVDEADDYESLKAAVVREYRDFAMPDELAELIRKSTILAEFAGEAAATQETE